MGTRTITAHIPNCWSCLHFGTESGTSTLVPSLHYERCACQNRGMAKYGCQAYRLVVTLVRVSIGPHLFSIMGTFPLWRQLLGLAVYPCGDYLMSFCRKHEMQVHMLITYTCTHIHTQMHIHTHTPPRPHQRRIWTPLMVTLRLC